LATKNATFEIKTLSFHSIDIRKLDTLSITRSQELNKKPEKATRYKLKPVQRRTNIRTNTPAVANPKPSYNKILVASIDLTQEIEQPQNNKGDTEALEKILKDKKTVLLGQRVNNDALMFVLGDVPEQRHRNH